jgi:hypothetical protein
VGWQRILSATRRAVVRCTGSGQSEIAYGAPVKTLKNLSASDVNDRDL